jgi:sarcosine oxidase gamma subunit
MRRSTYFQQFPAPSPTVRVAPGFESLGSAQVVARTPNGVRLRAGQASIDIAALASDLFRVELFGEGRPVTYRSDAVAKTDWSAPATEVASSGTRIDVAGAAAVVSLGCGCDESLTTPSVARCTGACVVHLSASASTGSSRRELAARETILRRTAAET